MTRKNLYVFEPIKIKPIDFGISQKKKRKTLTPAQRIYIWERPNIYGRTCSICHEKITKLSDLELDHTRAYSKGGVKLALSHKVCNRIKSNGSLREIQNKLGIKPKTKKHHKKKKITKRKTRKQKNSLNISLPKINVRF
ncbi:MAG: hypothetical protein ABIH52_03465 [Candidatus Aenigmatarchaeota archaeon]